MTSGPLTLQFAAASGVTFRYEPRGFVTRYRVATTHPLTEGLSPVGEWSTLLEPKEPAHNYGRLAHNVKAETATVLIEGEEEKCPYDGVNYVRQGEILGVRPLLTVATYGKGVVVRHYAAVSAPAVFGEEQFQRIATNLAKWAQTRRNGQERSPQGPKTDLRGLESPQSIATESAVAASPPPSCPVTLLPRSFPVDHPGSGPTRHREAMRVVSTQPRPAEGCHLVSEAAAPSAPMLHLVPLCCGRT